MDRGRFELPASRMPSEHSTRLNYRPINSFNCALVFIGNHFSIKKACDLLGMKPVPVKLDSNFTMDIDEARQKICSDTAVVVGIAGTTELGTVDPIPELSEIVASMRETGPILLHVDAAFGGFVLPFLEDMGGIDGAGFDFPVWDIA